MARYKKGTRVGPFTLEAELSDYGGMASVYRARVEDSDFPNRNGVAVAVKIARVTDSNAAIFEQLLIKETDLLHDLRHPGIVRICPIPQFYKRQYFARAVELAANPNNPDDAPWFFAMELLRGDTLSKIIESRKFSLEWRLEFIYQTAIIVDYLHLRQIVHRDLKPDNIMFRAAPHPKEIPTPVLIDFGLAEKRQLEPDVTAATISYASPERVEHLLRSEGYEPTDVGFDHAPSDVWSLGVIAYEMLTGQQPFGSSRDRTLVGQRIMNDPPEPMHESIPPNVRELVFDMLHKDYAKRPKIEEVTERLETKIEVIPPRI